MRAYLLMLAVTGLLGVCGYGCTTLGWIAESQRDLLFIPFQVTGALGFFGLVWATGRPG